MQCFCTGTCILMILGCLPIKILYQCTLHSLDQRKYILSFSPRKTQAFGFSCGSFCCKTRWCVFAYIAYIANISTCVFAYPHFSVFAYPHFSVFAYPHVCLHIHIFLCLHIHIFLSHENWGRENGSKWDARRTM